MIEEDRSNLRWLVGAALGIGLVFGGTFAAMHWNDKRIDRTAHGELDFAHLMRLADGRPVLLAVEKVLHSGGESIDTHSGRLDVVDAVTGARLARQIQIDVSDCRSASPGRIWCLERPEEQGSQRALVLRDLATLAVVSSSAQLQAVAPGLAKGIASGRGGPYVDPDGGAAITTTNDGVMWQIDPSGCPASCRASEREASASNLPGFGSTQYGKTPGAKIGDREYGFSNDGRGALVLKSRSSFGAQLETRVGVSTFLEPGFLADSASPDPRHETPLLLDDDRFLVVHSDSLDHSKAQRLLSSVDHQAAVRWRVELGKGELVAAWRVDKHIVVAMRADQGWLIAIDPRDGKVLWRRET